MTTDRPAAKESAAERIKRLVDGWPPLTIEQIARLREILSPLRQPRS